MMEERVPNSLIMKIQDGGERHIEFRKMLISAKWIKIFPPNLVNRRTYRQMNKDPKNGQCDNIGLMSPASVISWAYQL